MNKARDDEESQGNGKGAGLGSESGVVLKDNNEFVLEKMNSEKIFEKLKWITTKEAATYLRVSVGQIRNMVWRGQVKCFRMNNRLRFLKSDLDKIMKSTNDWRIHD